MKIWKREKQVFKRKSFSPEKNVNKEKERMLEWKKETIYLSLEIILPYQQMKDNTVAALVGRLLS